MKKTFLLLTLFLFSLSLASAQTTNEKLIFPSTNLQSSEGLFLVQTADGGYLLTGSDRNPSAGSYALPRLIKLTADLQVEWDNVYLGQSSPEGVTATIHSPALQTADGGYALAVRNDSSATEFLRLDANGNVLWEKDLIPWAAHMQLLGVLPDGGFALIVNTYPYRLMRLDADGNIVSQATLVDNVSKALFTLLSNGEVLTAYRNANGKTIFLRTDVDGNVIWQTDPLAGLSWVDNLGGTKLAAMPDGGFVMLAYDGTLNNNRLYRFDALGAQTWVSPASAIPTILKPTSINVTAAGRFVLGGHTVTNRGFVAQMNAAADGIEWSAASPEDGQEHLQSLWAIPTADGWAAGVGTAGDKFGFMKVGVNTGVFVNFVSGRVAWDLNENCSVEAAESGLDHTRVTASNGLETFGGFSDFHGNYQVAVPSGDFTLSVTAHQPFFSLCPTANVDVSFPAGSNGTATLDLPMESADLIHEISGTTHLDQNDNCATDAGEPPLQNWNVAVKAASGTLHLKTNADGQYKAFVPDGSYQVVLSPYNHNFLVCAPATQSTTLVGPSPQTATLDFVAQPEFLCARMRASLSASNIRPCTTGTIYVNYQNDGTINADNASLTVTLDPLLTYTGASATPAFIDGQSITFNLGDVAPVPGECWYSYIKIYVDADCSLAIGDQVCASVQVYPDEDCTESANWSGAIIAVTGVCENGDQAIFTIKNVGNAPSALLDYIITEDQIVLRQDTFQLEQGQEKYDTIPGNGLPLTIIADQEPGYPGDTSVVWNILNCGGTGSGMASGFGGPAGPFTTQRCFEISNSFDPNDKDAAPLGHGAAHFVHPGTPLDYRIRFQNTGNDTAFLVVIRDTLSPHFDMGKIEARGSSHPYTLAQISDSILQFTFKNILLPDSTTNLDGSQGFVEFNVYPKPDLADGTVVDNRAAIYFDYNEPVITNSVQRVYGRYAFVKIHEVNGKPSLPVQVYPNPFLTETTFELPEHATPGKYQLTLVDAAGRTLRTLSFAGNKCQLQRADLPTGVLAWRITTGGQTVAGGTVVAQ